MKYVVDIIKGFFIGIANIIPGMSGGTLALIMGIYERIIAALHNITFSIVISGFKLLTFKKQAFVEFGEKLKKIDAYFLLCLGGGAVIAVLSTSKVMSFLLKDYHEVSYAFFFGLVLMSMIFPYRYLKRRSWREFVSFAVAAALTISLTFMVSDDQKERKAELKYERELAKTSQIAIIEEESSFISLDVPAISDMIIMFFAAALAISAMVLPGISGSFVLLLIGVYFKLLEAINNREIILLMCFMLGCLAGLLFFSRIMDFLLKKFYNITMSFMVGLMAGSLYVLWPFKASKLVGDTHVYFGNILPESFGKIEVYSIIAALAGATIIFGFYLFEKKIEKNG
jgi:putative membrane protein